MGLIEGLQDQQAYSIVPYDIQFAQAHCEELFKISKIIYRNQPSAPCIAHFYKGQVLFTQARLEELEGPTQVSSHKIETLFEEAFKEFAAAKQLSDNLLVPLDGETQKYRSRSLYASAFILAKYPLFAHRETELVQDEEYRVARGIMLEAAHKQGDLVEVMVELDDKLVRKLHALVG